MNTRIAEIRKKKKLTQEEFGDRLGGLSRNYIWMIEKGDRVPSNRTIRDICDKFHVNEEWLREGVGEMFEVQTRSEEIAEFMGQLLDSPPGLKSRLSSVLSRTTTDEWALLEEKIQELSEEGQ